MVLGVVFGWRFMQLVGPLFAADSVSVTEEQYYLVVT